MLAMYATAATLCVAAGGVGQAVCALAGVRQWTWVAPAVGFATLLCIANVIVRLGGAGVAVAVAIVVATLAAVALVGARVRVEPTAAGLATAIPIALLTAVPFVINDGFGFLGRGLNDDLGFHLAWTEAFQTGADPFGLVEDHTPGYPVGPHPLAAGFAELFGDAHVAYQGLLVAVPILTGLTALAGLRSLPSAWRALAAVVVGMTYTGAAYYQQASLKEPLLGLLMLALVLWLHESRPAPPESRSALRARSGIPPGLILVASGLVIGYPGVLAGLAVLVAWTAAESWAGARRAGNALRQAAWRAAPALGVAAVVLLLGTAIEAGRLSDFIASEAEIGRTPDVQSVGEGRSTQVGFFPDQVSFRPVMGLWFASDLRFPPETRIYSSLASALAAMLVVYGAFWWVRRGDPGVVAAAGALLAILFYSRATVAPHFAAKWLPVAAPLLALIVMRALLSTGPRSPPGVRPLRRALRPRQALGVAFAALALWSSLLALRGAPVGPTGHADELISLRPLLRTGPTLFLGSDSFLRWELLGVRVSAPHGYVGLRNSVPYEARPEHGTVPHAGLDLDMIEPASLDRFRYVVTTRTDFASRPPLDWRRAGNTRSYTVWERRGQTSPREILDEGREPGAVLDCNRPEHRGLQRSGARGAERPRPAFGGYERWTDGAGRPPDVNPYGFAILTPGGDPLHQTVSLPPGGAALSLQYRGPVPIDVRAGSLRATLPANFDPEGPYWPVGTVTGSGPLQVELRARRLPRASLWPFKLVEVGNVAAAPVNGPVEKIPLAGACGRYLDWYEPPAPR